MRFAWPFIVSGLLAPAQAFADRVTVKETARLISFAEKGVEDRLDWAADLLDVLDDLGFDQSRENICASLAVIDQESGFRADPSVPGLGKLSEQALRDRFGAIPLAGGMALRFLETRPTSDNSYMLRIRNAKTERDLDLAYRSFVTDMSESSGTAMIVNSGLLNQVIDDRNDIDTAGSMQVSVKFALKTANAKRWLPMALEDVYAVRDQLYTRRGGMYYGILQLLGYDTGYDRKIYRFADYNAGRYASRNAAFQQLVTKLSKQKLALDGDLLLYAKGEPRSKASATEKAIRAVAKDFELDIDDIRIRKDLLKEKSEKFTGTQTYTRLREAYRRSTGRDAPFAILPDIALTSPKITRKMTTGSFAESVNKRYQSCMAVKL
jgi:hypothetical protein